MEILKYRPMREDGLMNVVKQNASDEDVEFLKAVGKIEFTCSIGNVCINLERQIGKEYDEFIEFKLLTDDKDFPFNDLVNTFNDIIIKRYEEELKKFRQFKLKVLAISEIKSCREYTEHKDDRAQENHRVLLNLYHELKNKHEALCYRVELLERGISIHHVEEKTKKKRGPGRPPKNKLNEAALQEEVNKIPNVIENTEGV